MTHENAVAKAAARNLRMKIAEENRRPAPSQNVETGTDRLNDKDHLGWAAYLENILAENL